jgi:hypothetical protein
MGRVVIILLLAAVLGGLGFAWLFLVRADAGASVLAELPGPVRGAAARGRELFVAADGAGLLRVDLDGGEVKRLLDAADQRFVDVAVSDSAVHVLGVTIDRKAVLHTVDPARHALVRSQSLSSSVADVVGFLKDGTLVVVEGSGARFLKPNGKTSYVPVSGGIMNGGWLGADRLYVARGYAGGLAVIDVAAVPVLLDVIETQDWLQSVAVSGKIAYVRGQTGMGRIDLAARGYRSDKALDVHVSAGGEVFAIGPASIWRLDEDGRARDAADLPEWVTEQPRGEKPRIVAAAGNEIIIARGTSLVRVTARFTGVAATAQAQAD